MNRMMTFLHPFVIGIVITVGIGSSEPALHRVCNGLLYGYADSRGDTAIMLQYRWAEPFSEGLAAVWNGYGYVYINTSGKVAIDCLFDDACLFRNGMARVRIGLYYGYIDKTGNLTIPVEYSTVSNFSEGYAVVRYGNIVLKRVRYIDKEGRIVLLPAFFEGGSFSDGLAPVRIAPKFMFVDKDSGLNMVGGNPDMGKWAYIDHNGNEIIPPTFKRATPFVGGIARVQEEDGIKLINRSGKVIWP